MPEIPDPFKYVRIYKVIVDSSSEFGCEILEEGYVNEEEYCEVGVGNAASGIALCSYMKESCLQWDPKGISFEYFDDSNSSKVGYGIFTYNGKVMLQGGRECDLFARFYPINTTKYKMLTNSNR